jgi:hypothetical protein
MATRSSISVKMADGSFKGVYCHFDGYLAHVGKMLATHYASQQLAEQLIAGGDISELHASCEGAPGHSFAHPVAGQTVYYGRDRNEHGVQATSAHTYDLLVRDIGQDFDYLWDGQQWTVRCKNGRNEFGAQQYRFDAVAA